jgi:hypothetical protein
MEEAVTSIEELEHQLHKAEKREEEAFEAAVEALRKALSAKSRAINADMSLWRARGETGSFKPQQTEAMVMHIRATRPGRCEAIVRRALTYNEWLDNLGLNVFGG